MSDFGPNVETTARNTLARNGITMREAARMTDRALLSLVGLGKESLRWIRANSRGRRCPTCGRRM